MTEVTGAVDAATQQAQVAAQQAQDTKNCFGCCSIGCLGLFVFFLAWPALKPSGSSPPAPAPVAVQLSMAQMLASIHTERDGHSLAASDSTVAEFQTLLNSITAKVPENETQVGDITVAMWQHLKKKGKPVPLLDLMRDCDAALPPEAAKKVKYSEIAAAVATLIIQGQAR